MKLRTIRKRQHLTLRAVASRLGVTPQAVRRAEVKGIKNLDTAKRYAMALGVSWQEVIEASPWEEER